jgi:hypothetical protein
MVQYVPSPRTAPSCHPSRPSGTIQQSRKPRTSLRLSILTPADKLHRFQLPWRNYFRGASTSTEYLRTGTVCVGREVVKHLKLLSPPVLAVPTDTPGAFSRCHGLILRPRGRQELAWGKVKHGERGGRVPTSRARWTTHPPPGLQKPLTRFQSTCLVLLPTFPSGRKRVRGGGGDGRIVARRHGRARLPRVEHGDFDGWLRW